MKESSQHDLGCSCPKAKPFTDPIDIAIGEVLLDFAAGGCFDNEAVARIRRIFEDRCGRCLEEHSP